MSSLLVGMVVFCFVPWVCFFFVCSEKSPVRTSSPRRLLVPKTEKVTPIKKKDAAKDKASTPGDTPLPGKRRQNGKCPSQTMVTSDSSGTDEEELGEKLKAAENARLKGMVTDAAKLVIPDEK